MTDAENELLNAAFVVSASKLENHEHTFEGETRPNGFVRLVNAARAITQPDVDRMREGGAKVVKMNAKLEAEVEGLKFQNEELLSNQAGLLRDLHDMKVQAAFWRRAAEQAVTGWDALEDKIDGAVQKLQAVAVSATQSEIAEVLAILVELSPLEPDTAALEVALRELPEVDLGDGKKLRVVEEETPYPVRDDKET